ncbi:MAG: amino acid adenylation domain-containing protein, partial [Gordonia paraffinivorans]
ELLDEDDVRELADEWVAAAAALARHVRTGETGGLTPSDVPLAPVSQHDLDVIEGAHGRVDDVWPLAPLQAGLLYHAEIAGDEAVDIYTAQVVLELRGPLDADRMRAAADAVVARNPVLRSAFHATEDGTPVAAIVAGARVEWERVDLSGRDDAADEADRLLRGHRLARFDMASAPLMRFLVIDLGTDDAGTPLTRMSMVNHHILLDGWSGPLLMQQLMALYALGGVDQLPAADHTYRDFLEWLSRREPGAALAAWRQALDGLDRPTMLVDRGAAPDVREDDVELASVEADSVVPVDRVLDLDEPTAAGLAELSRDRGITVNTMLQAAWGLVLARSLGSDDVVFGATVSGRPPEVPEVGSILGLFINTIPARVRLDERETVVGLLERVQSEQAGLLDAHHVGLPAIQRELGVGALFDTLVVFESYPIDRDSLEQGASIDGLSIDGAQVNDASHYPLTVLGQADPHLSVTLRYVPALVSDARAADLAARLQRVLTAFARASATPVRDVDLVDPAEIAAQLRAWNDTDRVVEDTTVAGLFAERVARTPDAVMLVDGDTTLTFAEFDAMANRRARVLIAHGIGPDDVVAVAMVRSVEQLATVHGILKAGAAYLPVDVDAPADRVAAIIAEAGVRCAVTDADRLARLRSIVRPVACLDLAARGLRHIDDGPISASELRGRVHPASLAYVLFTSGSTGRPKGVQITQRALVNQVRWIADEYGIDENDTVLLKTPFTFDASVWEMFTPGLVGATTVVAGPRAHTEPTEMVELVATHAVTVVQFVPSVLAVFVESAGDSALTGLRLVFSGGEALPRSLAAHVAERSGARVVNLYGPTEVTVDATSAVVVGDEQSSAVAAVDRPRSDGSVVSIGRPVWNTRGFVLDRWLRPCVVGAVGELYLGGDQLARGYLNRPGLTAERFVPNVFGPSGSLMYRTGDLVRRTPDGSLEYVGRVDFQVKLRGLRIELEEVEVVLARHASVGQAAVVIREVAGREQLVAYVTGDLGGDVDVAALRDFAGRALPGYMVPEVIVVLDEFPRGRSGKIARSELPVPDVARAERRAPATPAEEILVRIAGELLGTEIGADDSFFEIGGDSIGAMQLVTRARAAGLSFTARDVIEQRTLAALARRAEVAGGVPSTTDGASGRRTGHAEATPVIRKMVERGGDFRRFVMPMAFIVPGDVTAEQITRVLGAVVDAHDVLRSRFDPSGALEVGDAGDVDVAATLTRVDLDGDTLPGTDGYTATVRTAVADAIDLLDPASGAMMRLVWLAPPSGSGRTGRLVVVLHHLVVDAVSWQILQSDIAVAGSQVSSGDTPALPGTGTSWVEWSAALHDAAASRRDEIDHWVSTLDVDDPDLGTRRVDLTRDGVDRLARLEIEIPAEIVEPLTAGVRSAGADGETVADLLVAGLAAAVVGWRADRGVEAPGALLTLEGHGRQESVVDGRVDLSRTVGWFTSMFPTFVDLGGRTAVDMLDDPAAASAVVSAARSAMAAHPDRGIGYGMLRYLDPEGGRAAERVRRAADRLQLHRRRPRGRRSHRHR